MIKKILAYMEDPERPLLGPNYLVLRIAGFVLPENKIGKVAYILMHVLVAFAVLSQYIELYIIRSNLDQVLLNLKTSMLSIIIVIKAITYMIWQSRWKDVLDYVTVSDKYERDNNCDTDRGRILDDYTKYCRKLTYSYFFLVFITVATVIITPLVMILSSQNFRNDLRNGTKQFPHMLSTWMPFDKNHNPGTWLTIIWHTSLCTYGGMTMVAYDTSTIVILVFIGGKLDLLRERCKCILGRDGSGVSNEQASKMVHEMHEVHVLLTKYSRLFNSLLSPVMFFYVVMCAVMLCASAFQLTSAQDVTQKILMAEFLVFGVTQLFMFCWHSNVVIVKSENLVFGPYESEWWASNLYQRKAVHILSGQFRIKQIFTAGPFTDLTLSTFITILKGAYSYYTLISK